MTLGTMGSKATKEERADFLPTLNEKLVRWEPEATRNRIYLHTYCCAEGKIDPFTASD